MTSDRWQKIEQLYHAALQRDEKERAAYLEEACAGDDALRREVESLLQHQQGAESFLEAPAMQIAVNLLDPNSKPSLIGRRLGSYRVVSLLGSGGIGEVYQAQDSNLRRDVAIKVLPSAFTNNSERLARFQREARLLASLNHPNIATIHGLEQSDGVNFLVMELVPGKTLAERLQAGPMSIAEALRVAGQIAEALEAAHEKGVIHRDLKPANVKVIPEGRVKLLDFGLAKAFAIDGNEDLSTAPTLTGIQSEEGRILGTPSYMSPEQARGKPVDKRTDIWAFGCVLYEMLTAKQAFPGETLSDAIAAVLGGEPDWKALPASPSGRIRDLLRRCLQKDPQRRLRDIGDARIEIQEALETDSYWQPAHRAIPGRENSHPIFLWITLAAIALLAAVTGEFWLFRRSGSAFSPATARLGITVPTGDQLVGVRDVMLAIAPDGSHLVYAANRNGVRQLFLRAIDNPDPILLPGTENPRNPFFSSDGKWIAFYSAGKLKKISIAGTSAQTICDAPVGRGGYWTADNTIYYVPDQISGIWQVSAEGGIPRPVTTLDRKRGDISHPWPQLLPGGKALLFTAEAGPDEDEQQVEVQLLDTGERRILVKGGHHGIYVTTGYIVYLRDRRILAVPFDLKRLQVTSSVPTVMAENAWDFEDQDEPYSISESGSLVYVAGNAFRSAELVWVDRTGMAQPIGAPLRPFAHPRLSPDGRLVALQSSLPEGVWVYDLERATLTPLTPQEGSAQRPVWTPDGKRVTYRGTRGGYRNLFWKLADGSGPEERLTDSEAYETPSSWSPDGKVLAFSRESPSTGYDLWTLRLDDKRTPQTYLQTPFNEMVPRFSSDGRWLAYASNQSGRMEIYVQPFPGPGTRSQVSSEGGNFPVWSRDGRELFYRIGDKMMEVDVRTEPSFSAGKPRLVFVGHFETAPDTNYNVSLDGRRFLMIRGSEQERLPNQINVVLNWSEELKRLAPVNK